MKNKPEDLIQPPFAHATVAPGLFSRTGNEVTRRIVAALKGGLELICWKLEK